MSPSDAPTPADPAPMIMEFDRAGPAEPHDHRDRAAIGAQLGRSPRGHFSVAHRCACGLPDVIATAPLLPDGTPFPTLFYLTCLRANSAVGTLEAAGLMARMTERIRTDKNLAGRYAAAHEDYLRRRDELGPLATRESAGGMPTRVKCLHALVAHSLAVGPGVNPLGDEALGLLPEWWAAGPCVEPA